MLSFKYFKCLKTNLSEYLCMNNTLSLTSVIDSLRTNSLRANTFSVSSTVKWK